MKFIILIFLALTSVKAGVVDLDSEGVGRELLMNGAGVTMLGSEGSIIQNPSLLAWQSTQDHFFSMNKIQYYKAKPVDGNKVNISPEVVPVAALSGKGFGNWGHAFGFLSSQQSIVGDFNHDNQSGSFKQKLEGISLIYGIGVKLTEDFALGMSVGISRANSISDVNVYGISDGVKFLGIIENSESFWVTHATIGVTKIYSSWTLGMGARTIMFHFAHQAYEKQKIFDDANNRLSTAENHSKPYLMNVPSLVLGVGKTFESNKVYFDFEIRPGYVDEGEKYGRENSFKLAQEINLNESFNLLHGLTYKNDTSNTENQAVNYSFGFERIGKIATTYLGLSYQRELIVSNTELYSLNFGSKFEY